MRFRSALIRTAIRTTSDTRDYHDRDGAVCTYMQVPGTRGLSARRLYRTSIISAYVGAQMINYMDCALLFVEYQGCSGTGTRGDGVPPLFSTGGRVPHSPTFLD